MLEAQDAPVSPRSQTSWRSTFAAFRWRNYRLFFFGQLISVIGSWMQNVAMSWLVYELTNSRFLLGVIGALSSLPSLFFSVFGGALVDRLPKRWVIVCTQTAAMTLAFVLAALVHWNMIHVWHVAVVALCSGTVMAIDIPARQSFVVEMVGQEDLMNAIALNSSCFNLARILGPSVAAIVIVAGIDWCFFINGLSFLAVIAGLMMMRLPRWVKPQTDKDFLRHVLEGFAYIRTQRRILIVLTMMGTMAVFGFAYQILMPVFARDILKVGAQGMALLTTANGIGALTAALFIASRSRPTRRLLFGSAIVFAATIYGFSLSETFSVSFAALIVAGASGVAFMATCNTTLQLAVPHEMRGRVMGMYSFVFVGLGPFGSLLFGSLGQALGAPAAVCIGAAICGCSAITLWMLVARWRARDARVAAGV